MSKNATIINAMHLAMNAGKTSLSYADLKHFYGDIPAATIRGNFAEWKNICERLWIAAQDYFLADYSRLNPDPSALYAAYKSAVKFSGIEEEGLAIVPTDGEQLRGWPLNIIAAMSMGNDGKDENGIRTPTPCSVNTFRGKFERWFYRAVTHAVVRNGEEYRAYKAKLDAERAERNAEQKAARQAHISAIKADLKKKGMSDKDVEQIITMVCKLPSVRGVRNPEKYAETFDKALNDAITMTKKAA